MLRLISIGKPPLLKAGWSRRSRWLREPSSSPIVTALLLATMRRTRWPSRSPPALAKPRITRSRPKASIIASGPSAVLTMSRKAWIAVLGGEDGPGRVELRLLHCHQAHVEVLVGGHGVERAHVRGGLLT